MIKPLVSAALLLGFPALATAQSGTVRYTETIPLDFKLPPNSPMADRLPKTATKLMQLTFSPQAALYAEAPLGDPNGAAGRGEARVVSSAGGGGQTVFIGRDGGGGGMDHADVMMMSAFGMPGGGSGGTLSGAFTNLADGSYIEVRDFLGKTFRIPEARPTIAWKLTGEQAMFLGHPVMQAKAKQDSTSLEAWFTPDIPVATGPAQYGGLPGLILTLTVDSNKVIYTATAIDITTPISAIKAPTDGSKVTRAEYDKIVKDKMAEMSQGRRGRGGN